jgi:DNA-directed RNA polymerase III subunit RPC5
MDDPVIRELDVYVSQDLLNHLYLLQYPMRPMERPLETPVAAKIKPQNHKLEIKHSIVQSGKNYDTNVPQLLLLKEQTHGGTRVAPVTNYAIGIVRENELHLTPVHAIMQMRPMFKHVNEAARRETEDMDDGTQAEDAPKEVMFKKKESERATEARQRSYAHKKSQEEAEQWVELAVKDPESDTAKQEFEQMYCSQQQRRIKFREGTRAYLAGLDHLCDKARPPMPPGDGDAMSPFDVSEAEAAMAASTLDPSAYFDQPLPVAQLSAHKGVHAIKAYLRTAYVLSHAMLKEVTGVQDDDAVVHELRGHAVLVRGNWVLSTHVLHKGDARATTARDLLLLLLHRHGAVNRVTLQNALDLQPNYTKGILEQVAALDRVAKWWHPQLADGVDFALLRPNDCALAEQYWDKKEQELTAKLGATAATTAGCTGYPSFREVVAQSGGHIPLVPIAPAVAKVEPHAEPVAAVPKPKGKGRGAAAKANAAAAAAAAATAAAAAPVAAKSEETAAGADVAGDSSKSKKGKAKAATMIAAAKAAKTAVATARSSAGGAADSSADIDMFESADAPAAAAAPVLPSVAAMSADTASSAAAAGGSSSSSSAAPKAARPKPKPQPKKTKPKDK